MESVPVEILEKMFMPLSSLNDIEKCFNTSTKWRQIIVKTQRQKLRFPSCDHVSFLIPGGMMNYRYFFPKMQIVN